MASFDSRARDSYRHCIGRCAVCRDLTDDRHQSTGQPTSFRASNPEK
jgi:hypothetical protein